jgi:hypothetical protein
MRFSNETKVKEKQNKTIPDSNSNLAKSMTHHNQTKELTTWFLNLLSVSQLVDADLSVLFHKSDSHVLDSSSKRVCGNSCIGNIFQADFSFAQSSLRCLISQSSSEL